MKPISRITAVLLVIGVYFSYAAFAQVNVAELQSAPGATDVRFINYTGPNAVVNTMAQITAIGSGLGSLMRQTPPQTEDARALPVPATAGTENRYYVVHVTDPAVPQGLDADIFILGRDAAVDHIRNLRAIIAGYLTSAYDYSAQDASALATYITVYNAVYRGKTEVFGAKYKPLVVSYLNTENAGLSTNYADWPGKTRIVIPLTGAPAGNPSAIDTTIISDKTVVQSLREEPGMAVDTRKDMVDLKEREAETAVKTAQESAQAAVAAQQAAREAQQAAVTAQQAATVAQQAATVAQQAAQAQPQNAQAQQEAQTARETANQLQQDALQKQQQAAETQQTANQLSQTAQEQQTLADRKTAEAQNDRGGIAQDQMKVIQQETAAAQQMLSSVYGLKLVDEKNLFSSIVLVNSQTGQLISESPVRVIRGRSVLPAPNGFIAVAGDTASKNGAIRLVLIDGKTLDIKAQSIENVAPQAALLAAGGMYYTVVENGKGYAVAKYDANAQLQNKSVIAVLAGTPLTLTDGGIIVTDDKNTPRILSISDLTEKKQ